MAMRAALWLLSLFAIAVGVAMFAGNNDGSVTFFWSPHRVDISLNLFVLALFLGFVVLHLALRALFALLNLPTQASRFRALQRTSAMHAALQAALVHFLAGRFLRAGKSAREAVLLSASGTETPFRRTQVAALSHLLAAESAHQLQDSSLRDAQLDLAMQAASKEHGALHEAAQLRAARWALNAHQPQAALRWLEKLSQGAQRRTVALRIRLKAARQDRQNSLAMDTARLLAKHGAFTKEVAPSLLRSLGMEALNDAHDVSQLQRSYAALSPAEQAMPELTLHAAHRMVQLAGGVKAQGPEHPAQAWLLASWKSYAALSDNAQTKCANALVASGVLAQSAWLAQVDAAQRANPRDGRLHYLAGMACVQKELWGKAQVHLKAAVQALSATELRRAAWVQLATLAEREGDAPSALAAWKAAAQA